jgi:TonB family protein
MLTLSIYISRALRKAVLILITAAAYTPLLSQARDFVHVTPAELERIMISSPSPKYPLPARVARQKGSGLFRLFVRKHTGEVTRVEIAKSTGYHLLDDAAVGALRQWRLRPGTDCDGLIVPVTFTF